MKGGNETQRDCKIRNDSQSHPSLILEERNQAIEQYLPLVRKIAGYVIRNNSHRIDYEDLVNIGVLGLMQALENYDPAYDVNFAGYCKARIRGAMLDELRRLDWVPRLKRKQFRDIENAQQEFQQRFNRIPNPDELTEGFDISANTLTTCRYTTRPVKMLSLNGLIGHDDPESDSFDFIASQDCKSSDMKADQQNSLEEFTKGLTKNEQLVLILYYQEELTMHQTGLLLGISESRVCQIHSHIIARLKTRYQQQSSIWESARTPCMV